MTYANDKSKSLKSGSMKMVLLILIKAVIINHYGISLAMKLIHWFMILFKIQTQFNPIWFIF